MRRDRRYRIPVGSKLWCDMRRPASSNDLRLGTTEKAQCHMEQSVTCGHVATHVIDLCFSCLDMSLLFSHLCRAMHFRVRSQASSFYPHRKDVVGSYLSVISAELGLVGLSM